jgi:hypothetical protein
LVAELENFTGKTGRDFFENDEDNGFLKINVWAEELVEPLPYDSEGNYDGPPGIWNAMDLLQKLAENLSLCDVPYVGIYLEDDDREIIEHELRNLPDENMSERWDDIEQNLIIGSTIEWDDGFLYIDNEGFNPDEEGHFSEDGWVSGDDDSDIGNFDEDDENNDESDESDDEDENNESSFDPKLSALEQSMVVIARLKNSEARDDAIAKLVPALLVSGHRTEAQELYERIEDEGWKRNAAASPLLRAYLDADESDRASAILDTLEDDEAREGVCADAIGDVECSSDEMLARISVLYFKLTAFHESDKATAKLIEALVEEVDQPRLHMAQTLFDKMNKSEARSEAGSALIEAYGKTGALDKAQAVFDRLKRSETESSNALSNLIEAYGAAIKAEKAQALLIKGLQEVQK